MNNSKLTPKMENFVLSYLRQGVASDAYREAYDAENMKDETIRRRAWELLQIPKIAARVQGLQKTVEKNVIYGVMEAMRDAVALHTADANDLVQVRRLNCRHCHGAKHAYQWKNVREFADATVAWVEREKFDKARRGPKTLPPPRPTDEGGYGFIRIADPHPGCPKCDGEGIEDIKIMDTRKLKGKAKMLYAGAKMTRDGRIEILTRNQDLHLTNVMKALGMFADTVKVLPPGAPADGVPALPDDPIEASRAYQAWLRGDKG